MKRKLFGVLIILLLTGCTANYNLVIEDEQINETITLSASSNEKLSREEIYSLYGEEHPIYSDEEFAYYNPTEKIEGQSYYEKDMQENSNGYVATYKASYDFDDYNRATALNVAYGRYSVLYDSETSTYNIIANNLKIFDANANITNVNITITLKDYEVVENNATNISGNVYTWSFDRNSEGTLNLSYKKKAKNNNDNGNGNNGDNNKKQNPLANYTLYIFCGILLILILIGYKIFNNIKNKSEKMDD